MRNSSEENQQIKYNNLQLRNKIESCDEVQQGYQIQIRLSRIYKIQIQSKPITKLKIRRIKIQIHVHLLSSAYLCQVEDLILKI